MKDTGGPAYPITGWQGSQHDNTGISVRDHFAGLAMMGYANLPDFYDMSADSIADMAYAQADAMIEARRR